VVILGRQQRQLVPEAQAILENPEQEGCLRLSPMAPARQEAQGLKTQYMLSIWKHTQTLKRIMQQPIPRVKFLPLNLGQCIIGSMVKEREED
jgi:hypothetical protein